MCFLCVNLVDTVIVLVSSSIAHTLCLASFVRLCSFRVFLFSMALVYRPIVGLLCGLFERGLLSDEDS